MTANYWARPSAGISRSLCFSIPLSPVWFIEDPGFDLPWRGGDKQNYEMFNAICQ